MFKLYGEVDSDKNTTIRIWLNDGVYWQWQNYMFRHIAPSSGFDSFLAIRVVYVMHIIQGESLARGPKLLSIKNYVIEIIT